jgi:glycosyltransferase involved in cell wall biosynthesis
MDLMAVTPLVLTRNEEPNLARCLGRLGWAKEVLVLDSLSTDGTCGIATGFPGVRLLERPFDSFAEQCNFGLTHVRSEWVLSLDADYILSPQFVEGLKTLQPADDVAGFSASFRYCIQGQPLRATLYPPRTVLYRRVLARYENDGHAHRVRVNGQVKPLKGVIFHDDRKPFSHWLQSQDRYAKLEVDKLTRTPTSGLGLNDRVRNTIILGPPAALLYTLFVRGVVLDGWAGWYYAFQRALAETLLSLRLMEAKLGMAPSDCADRK